MTELTYAAVQRKKNLIRLAILVSLTLLSLLVIKLANQEQSQATPDNTLRISGPWEFTSLDPSKQGYIYTRMQLTETLLNVDEKGQLTPGLAQHWQVSEDGKTWRFELRDNVLFHDGARLGADAVVNSLQIAQKTHGVLQQAPITAIKSLIAKEDSTEKQIIEIELFKPFSSLGALLANYSTAILSPASYDAAGQVIHLYGTGAYQLERFEPPHKLLVKANADYWGQKPSIAYASYLTGHRAESRILQARSGDADISFTLDPSMVSHIKPSDPIQVEAFDTPRTLIVKLNSAHQFLEPKARLALSLGLDRQAIADTVMSGVGKATSQLLPDSMQDWHLGADKLDASQTLGANTAKAKTILKDLGWQLGTDGVLVRDGQRFEITMMTYADRPELTLVATAIQAQWRKLGVDLKVDVTNSSMIPAGHQDKSLEAALIARNYGVIADPLPMLSGDFSNTGGDWGAMNWQMPDVDEAFARFNQQGMANAAKRDLSQKIMRLIYQEKPVIPIAFYQDFIAINNRVKGFKFDPYSRSYFINQMRLAPRAGAVSTHDESAHHEGHSHSHQNGDHQHQKGETH